MAARWRTLLLVTLVGAIAAITALSLSRSAFLQTVERKSYDWRWRNVPPTAPPSDAVLVLIDEATLRFFATTWKVHWPLPRDLYCPVLTWLHHAGARAVVFDIAFTEPDEQDETLATCLRDNGHAFLAWTCQPEGDVAPPPWTVPVSGRPPLPIATCAVLQPTAPLLAAARGGGRVDLHPDEDGVLRGVQPLQPVAPGRAVPVLGLAALAGAPTQSLAFDDGSLRVGEHVLPLDAEGRVLLPWRADGWPVLSFATVYANGILLQDGQPAPLSTAQVRDKVVFIGASATALFDLRVTPVQEVTPGVQAHAALYDAVSTGRAVRRLPAAAEAAILIVLCLLVAMASMMLTRQSAQLLGAMAILLLHLAGAALLFRYRMVWLDVVAPTAGMALAFATGATVNYRLEGRARRQIRNAFAHYLAPSVIEQLVRDPSRLQLGGERREITAFFSDIQGFTTISEQLEPGALVALLNECLGAMTDIVLEEGGTIDKYIGDAIVAMFGAPLSQPDHAERACRAALRCQARLVQLREDWTRRGLPALRVRIGLNTGQALVGNMGSRQRFDFTMMGDTVNLASRLESAAGRYGVPILAGEATFDAAGRQVPMREIDRLRVKGKRQGVRVFEVRDHADAVLDPLFANGLEALRSRRWPDARAALGQVLVATPADGPAQVLLDRADLYAQAEPPADWDGTWELTSK